MKEKRQRLPSFVKNSCRSRSEVHKIKARLRKARLHTVCESARCPNIVECFSRPTAAFMILGSRCNRGCGFCAVESGPHEPVDPDEPEALAEAARELGLRHVVVTSVTRDDLADGGAVQFARVIRSLRERLSASTVEVLVPDFGGEENALRTVMEAGPDVLNHNLETVFRLYPEARPRADYRRSLDVLRAAAGMSDEMILKSGLMVGLGETKREVKEALRELCGAGCRIVTIGQYLQPRKDKLPVARYLEPAEYDEFVEEGEGMGLQVFAGPLVRSSYMADRVFEEFKQGE
ncbi:MAG: lipoyl synthase [bacterium]